MALTITNGKVTATDGGTYTWADVVAIAGASIVLTDGIYFCDIAIIVTSGTLNIASQSIVFKQAIATADNSSGVINFGEKAGNANGKIYTFNGCDISIQASAELVGGYFETTAAGAWVNPKFNLYGCNFRFLSTVNPVYFGFSECVDTVFLGNSPAQSNGALLTIQPGETHTNCRYANLSQISILDGSSKIVGASLNDCSTSLRVSTSNELVELRGIEINQSNTFDFAIKKNETDLGFRFIDSKVDLANCDLRDPSNLRFKSVSVNMLIVDENGPVQDALMTLISTTSAAYASTDFSHVSDAAGALPEVIADIESAQNDTPLVTVDHSVYQLFVLSFAHITLFEVLTLDNKIGCGSAAPERIVLMLDPNIVMTEAEAIALTAVNNASDAYNRYKAEYRLDRDIPRLDIEGNQLMTHGVNVILDPSAAEAFSYNGAEFIFKTNRFVGGIDGDVTLMNGAKIEGGDYGRVILDSGFTGNVTFVDITLIEIVNNTTQDVYTNVVNTANAPRPCLEAQ
jgi:hypothetical protein